MMVLRFFRVSTPVGIYYQKRDVTFIRFISKTVDNINIKFQKPNQMLLGRTNLLSIPCIQCVSSIRPLRTSRSILKNPALLHIRSFSTSWILSKDAEKLDLDIWKSVMKSQALSAQEGNPESDDDDEEEDNAPIDESSGSSQSVLNAHRELVEAWYQAGKIVPKSITDEELQELARKTSKTGKKKYLKFLAIKERHKINNKQKKELKRAEREAGAFLRDVEEDSRPPLNTYILKPMGRSLEHPQGWKVAQAMKFGQPLVFDMSYEAHMSQRDLENTVSQLLESEGWNRRLDEPFHIHFCNLDPRGAYYRELKKRYTAEVWDRLMITATERSPHELFPPQEIVYLTADSRNVLRSFHQGKVYVVGAIVDRSILPGLSLARAKRLSLSTARLPLDEHLDWQKGAKNLCLDQMMRILGTLKETGNWEEALSFVPQRKHTGVTHTDPWPMKTRRSPLGMRKKPERAKWWRDEDEEKNV